MKLSGSITFNIESENDLILAAQLFQKRTPIIFPQHVEPPSLSNEEKGGMFVSDAEVLAKLRESYPDRPFTRAQANQFVKKAVNLSPSKTGRLLRKAIDGGVLKRLKVGLFTFEGCKEPVIIPSRTTGKKKHHRNLSRERRSTLKTLENPLLFFNFVRKLKEVNPEGIDEQLIDRSLEPQEALNDLRKRYPNIQVYKEEDRDFTEEFRDYMRSLGIDNANVQDLVIARMESNDAFSELELKAFVKAQQVVSENIVSKHIGE